jgi:hypothetical protein
MHPSRVLSAWHALPMPQRQFLLFAVVVAVALLSLYVQLLHTSLARGDELREVQRTAVPTKATKAVTQLPQATLARARNVSDSGGSGRSR